MAGPRLILSWRQAMCVLLVVFTRACQVVSGGEALFEGVDVGLAERFYHTTTVYYAAGLLVPICALSCASVERWRSPVVIARCGSPRAAVFRFEALAMARAAVFSAAVVLSGMGVIVLCSEVGYPLAGYFALGLDQLARMTLFFAACANLMYLFSVLTGSVALSAVLLFAYGSWDYVLRLIGMPSAGALSVGWGLTVPVPEGDVLGLALCALRLALVLVVAALASYMASGRCDVLGREVA